MVHYSPTETQTGAPVLLMSNDHLNIMTECICMRDCRENVQKRCAFFLEKYVNWKLWWRM